MTRLVIADRHKVDMGIVCRELAAWLGVPVTSGLDGQERAVFTTEVSRAALDAAAFALLPYGGWHIPPEGGAA